MSRQGRALCSFSLSLFSYVSIERQPFYFWIGKRGTELVEAVSGILALCELETFVCSGHVSVEISKKPLDLKCSNVRRALQFISCCWGLAATNTQVPCEDRDAPCNAMRFQSFRDLTRLRDGRLGPTAMLQTVKTSKVLNKQGDNIPECQIERIFS